VIPSLIKTQSDLPTLLLLLLLILWFISLSLTWTTCKSEFTRRTIHPQFKTLDGAAVWTRLNIKKEWNGCWRVTICHRTLRMKTRFCKRWASRTKRCSRSSLRGCLPESRSINSSRISHLSALLRSLNSLFRQEIKCKILSPIRSSPAATRTTLLLNHYHDISWTFTRQTRRKWVKVEAVGWVWTVKEEKLS